MAPLSAALFHPSVWRSSLTAAYVLTFRYAHLKSVATSSSIDASEKPVPWYTYPAIDYLKQLDFTDRTVFEYGSGNSTRYWASVAKSVVSVEHDERWHATVAADLPANCELILEPDLGRYPDTLRRTGSAFDVIVVDGASRGHTRLKCAQAALEHLRRGGMIILDNSDWLPESARTLREGGLIQVDMTGFAPIAANTQTTSFFLDRAFDFRPSGPRQPMPGPGAAGKVWEAPESTVPPIVRCGGEVFGAVHRDERITFVTPSQPRTFRFIAGSSSSEGGYVALIDMERDRVALAISNYRRQMRRVETDVERALRMRWPEFVRFVNRHEKRMYPLNEDGSVG